MKKRNMSLIVLGTIILIAGILLFAMQKNVEYIEQQDQNKVQSALELLRSGVSSDDTSYSSYALLNLNSGSGYYEASTKSNRNESLDFDETITYMVDIDKAGTYFLALNYDVEEDVLSEFVLDVSINGEQQFKEMKTIILPLLWEDYTDEFPLDRYGDETAPKQVVSTLGMRNYFYDTTFSTALPLKFYLEAGENEISIRNVSSNGLLVGTLEVQESNFGTKSYDTYLSDYQAFQSNTNHLLHTVNAVDYVSKNTTQAIYVTENNPSVYPHNVEYRKLNTLNYSEAGVQIDYEIEVEEDGLYEISLHYKNQKEEFDSFISIYLDGEIPFEECISYTLPTTGSSYKNLTIQDENENPYLFYLTAGKHVLSIRSEQENIIQAWEYGRLIAEHVTRFSLDITKIAGTTIDKNRTWQMTRYIENIPEILEAYEILTDEIRYMLQDYSEFGISSSVFSDLDKITVYLETMKEYPDEIALYTSELSGEDSSILALISNFTTSLSNENVTLDRIYISRNSELPKESAGMMASINNWFATLLNSFTTNKYDVAEKKDGQITVWVNRAVTHVDLLQKMVDTEFTPATGIDVQISAMPDVSKLTLAASAGDTPDVALGLASYLPFELASRGALYDMTQFEDFWEVADRSVPGVYVPYTYNEGVYALPETIEFHVLAYREDIFETLNLTLPQTWDDVVSMLPTLQRYGMNFYHNISAGTGYKWFYQTSSLIFQNDGEIYSEDGLTSALDTQNSIKGLQQLGNLFVNYSLDTQVNSFLSSFRYSILPIGIIDSNDYVLLKNGAPELEGQWSIALYPGTEKEDGTIDRTYVASSTGGVIFNDSAMIDESYEFIKWWTDYETQVNYAHTLKSTYGDQFFWLSANIDALANAPIAQQDKEVILEQISWINDVPRTPGQYLVERSISDSWNEIVFEGTSAQVVIDSAIIPINREIKKKMVELGYYNDDGSLAKPYVIRDRDWIEEQIANAKKGD